MFFVSIRMQVSPAKRMEITQALTSLMSSMRTEQGCCGCNCYQSVEDENELLMLGEWDCRESLDRHLRSKDFKVLLGAMHLLKEPHHMRLYEVTSCLEKGGDASNESCFEMASG